MSTPNNGPRPGLDPASLGAQHDAAVAGVVAPMSAPPAEVSAPVGGRGMDSLGFVMDVPVELTVELGRKRVRIGDILRLGPGSVLELGKANGDPLDIYVNNRLVARGEAVVVGERYGVRLTDVLVGDDAGQGGIE